MALYLKNKKKIETIFEKGFDIKSGGLLFRGYDFKDGETKYAVSVPKKLFPLAVERNLIKRRIKEQAKIIKLTGVVSNGVSFFLIYNSKRVLRSNEIKKSIHKLIQKL